MVLNDLLVPVNDFLNRSNNGCCKYLLTIGEIKTPHFCAGLIPVPDIYFFNDIGWYVSLPLVDFPVSESHQVEYCIQSYF